MCSLLTSTTVAAMIFVVIRPSYMAFEDCCFATTFCSRLVILFSAGHRLCSGEMADEVRSEPCLWEYMGLLLISII